MPKTTPTRPFAKLSPKMQRPYGFCCEEKDRDPDKYYDMQNPPFVSSLSDVILNDGGPGVKFRVVDVGRPPYSVQLRRTLEVKGVAYLGSCKRCRGPLQWHLEDEIALAREIMAKEKRINYNKRMKRNLKIAKQKKRKCKNRIKGTKFQKKIALESEIGQDNQELPK